MWPVLKLRHAEILLCLILPVTGLPGAQTAILSGWMWLQIQWWWLKPAIWICARSNIHTPRQIKCVLQPWHRAHRFCLSVSSVCVFPALILWVYKSRSNVISMFVNEDEDSTKAWMWHEPILILNGETDTFDNCCFFFFWCSSLRSRWFQCHCHMNQYLK